MVSWPRINLCYPIAEEEETYLDQREEGAGGTKNGLCWGDVCELLREIQAFNGDIQRRDYSIPPLRTLGLGLHGRDLRWQQESGEVHRP